MIKSEELILDACLSDSKNIAAVANRLEPNDFSDFNLGQAFKSIKDLFVAGKPIDLVIISEKCKKYFEASYLTDFLGQTCWYGTDIDYHADIIRQQGLRRRLKETLLRSIKTVDDTEKPFNEIAGEISQKIFNVISDSTQQNETDLGTQVLSFYDLRKKERLNGKQYAGIPTGISNLDEAIGGLRAGTLTIFAARSSHGKTTLAQDIFYKSGLDNYPCLYVGLEAPKLESFLYLIQKHMGLSPLQIKNRQPIRP